MKRIFAAISLVLILLVAVGCGGSDDSSSGSTAAETTSATAAGECTPDQLEMPAVARLSDQGLLEYEGDRLRVMPRGMLLLDAILAEIVRVS